MITEDYVSFETAKLLKEKGFDEPCTYLWIFEKTNNPEVDDNGVYKCPVKKYTESDYWNNTSIELFKKEDEYWNNNIDFFACPTLQMAMKWLREEHNLFIEIQYATSLLLQPHTTIYFQIYYMSLDYTTSGKNMLPDDYVREYYTSYEEAAESAIKYCLENLT